MTLKWKWSSQLSLHYLVKWFPLWLKIYITNMINVTILKKKGFVIAFGARVLPSRGWFAPMASNISISLHFEHECYFNTNTLVITIIWMNIQHQTVYMLSFDHGIPNIVFIMWGATWCKQTTLHTVSFMSHFIVIQTIQTNALHWLVHQFSKFYHSHVFEALTV